MEYIAHKRESDKKEQTVQEHLNDVSIIAQKYANVLGISHLLKLAGNFHDSGKLCLDFTDYINGNNNIKRGEIDHCYTAGRYFFEIIKENYPRDTDENKKRFRKIKESTDFISRVILSHHGLHDWIDENRKDYFEERIKKDKRYSEIKRNIGSMFCISKTLEDLEKASEEYKSIKEKVLGLCTEFYKEKSEKWQIERAFYMGLFERLATSILVDADRTNTSDFMLNKDPDPGYDQDIWTQITELIEVKCNEFKSKADEISNLRNSISDRCLEYSKKKHKICRLVVPTGGGKTISSLRFAANYCKNHHLEKIFYIAPYMSILEQNSSVFKAIVGDQYVLEHHSNIISGLNTTEELENYELHTERWDTPIITTTMVQFLEALFSDKMSAVRRMHLLCNSVIIIDEIQSIPDKCVSLFNLAMNFLSEIGKSCIVLCSATQPTFEKNRFYPIKIDEDCSMTGDYTSDFLAFQRSKIVPVLLKEGYTNKMASEFCMQQFNENGNVLMIVNTKKVALDIYEKLKETIPENTYLIHLSTSMCPEHRRDAIKQIEELLKTKKRVICVTTQLIEAGVDISFNCVIRSLAGLDNAAQAAGRCNRNKDVDYCCPVYLINMREEHLKNLPKIAASQTVSGHLITIHSKEDLLSVNIMDQYFRKYYHEQEEFLDYEVKDCDITTSLIKLLSINHIRYIRKTNNVMYDTKHQAFKTAGQKFCVIDNNTSTSVIVPYNQEAISIIHELTSKNKWDNSYELLRKAQKYTVDIYDNVKNKLLEKSAIYQLSCGAYILEKENYDKDTGVIVNGKAMDLLMY